MEEEVEEKRKPTKVTSLFYTLCVEMGKDICVNVTFLGSCNFLLSKAT